MKYEVLSKMSIGMNMILTSGGMGAKVLIADLMLEREGIYIDIGSALDLIATKKDSRGYMPYEEMKTYFRSILPPAHIWENDRKYSHIYTEANLKLGTHLQPPPQNTP